MGYIQVAILAAAYGLGFWTGYSWQAGRIESMEASIATQKAISERLLDYSNKRVKQAEDESLLANNELDKANAQSLETINAYHSKLASVRLYDPGRKGCRNAVPKSHGADVTESQATDGQELSGITARFLRDEARRADGLRAYADTCHRFVSTNCGIK